MRDQNNEESEQMNSVECTAMHDSGKQLGKDPVRLVGGCNANNILYNKYNVHVRYHWRVTNHDKPNMTKTRSINSTKSCHY